MNFPKFFTELRVQNLILTNAAYKNVEMII